MQIAVLKENTWRVLLLRDRPFFGFRFLFLPLGEKVVTLNAS